MKRYKTVFMGTAEFSVPTLEALVKTHDVLAVYTRAPKPAGRGYKLVKSPVHEAAERLGLEVRTPASFKSPEEVEKLKALNADVAVVVAYGIILPESVLTAFPMGCLNIHGSILPKWRGAAPIERALMAGDTETGVTIIQMDAGVDTGDMLMKQSLPITLDDTSQTLRQKLSVIGADLILKVLQGEGRKEKQPDEGMAIASKLEKEEGLLDFSQPADVLHRKIRALPCYFTRNGEKISVMASSVEQEASNEKPGTILSAKKKLIVQTGTLPLHLCMLKKPGGKAIDDTAFLNGYPLSVGEQLCGTK